MKTKYLEKLKKLYTELNYKGWDGYGADPISKEAYENTKLVIEKIPENTLKHFILFPGVWGNLDLTLRERLVGGMDIYEDEFVYAACLEDTSIRIGGREKFTVERVIDTLTEIINFHKL